MAKVRKSILRDPVESLVEDVHVSKHALHNRAPSKLDPNKESRAYYLTNYAYCLIQGIAEKTGPGPAAMIELIMREAAEKYLTKDERIHLEEVAQAMTARREVLIKQLAEPEHNGTNHT